MNPIFIVSVLVAFVTVYFLTIDPNYNQQLFKYKTYGSKDKPPLVLIPGLDGAVAFFADTIPELVATHYVITYFIPLKQASQPQSEYTFEYMANDLKSVLDELGYSTTPVSITGESFGGIIAQHFAFMFPNRVSKLVLLSSLARADFPWDIQMKQKFLIPILAAVGSIFPKFAQVLFAIGHVDDIMEAFEPKSVRDLFLKEASFAHFPSVIARIHIAGNLDIRERTKTIQAPTLLIYGSDDHFTKPSSFELNKLIHNSEITALPGGHLPHVTSYKEFANLVSNFCLRSK